MFSVIAHAIARKRTAWIICVTWLVVVAAISRAPKAQTSTQQQDFLPSGDDSIVASHIASDQTKYPRRGAVQFPLIIIYRNDNGLAPDDVARARQVSDFLSDPSRRPAVVTGVQSVFTANQLAPGAQLPSDPRFVSSDGKTMTMTALFEGRNPEKLSDPATQVEQVVKDSGKGDAALQTGVSGAVAQVVDSGKAFKDLNGILTIFSVILIFVLLVVIYRAILLPFVALISVGLAYALSQGLFGLIARGLGLLVNPQSTSLALVLILGAGTDYALFIASRYREELRQYESKYEAMWHTMANVGEAIASSALIVVVTLLVLVFASLKFFSNLGPSAALAIACMLLAGLTLVPAILVLLGRRAFWPAVPHFGETHNEDSGFWARVARVVARRPGAVLALTGGLFLVLAGATAGLKQRYDFVSNFPVSYPSRQGQGLLEKAGPADVGRLSPTTVYVSSNQPVLAQIDQLYAISEALAQTKGVQTVTPFSGPQRPTADQVRQRDAAQPDSRIISADGKTAQIVVYLNENPYGARAMDLIPAIRSSARAAVKGRGLTINVGGETALDTDTRSDITRDEILLGPIIFLAIGIILAGLLRSAVAPLYLLASTLLSFFATLGLTSFVFQRFFGATGIQDFVPPFMAVFLIALGADYNVFIMSRVREEVHWIGIHAGTQRALARTGGVITSAGIILAGTFAVLLILPLQFLQQIGFSVAAGVLLDTFLVRALLVPSVVFLLGRWNWWPSSASRADTGAEPVGAAI